MTRGVYSFGAARYPSGRLKKSRDAHEKPMIRIVGRDGTGHQDIPADQLRPNDVLLADRECPPGATPIHSSQDFGAKLVGYYERARKEALDG